MCARKQLEEFNLKERKWHLLHNESVVITSCRDFYQEKQRGRDRAPVLSSKDYTIVITAMNSHSPDSSYKEKLLYRKVEAFIHRQNMSLILFTCVLCRAYIYLLIQKLIESFCYRTGILLFSIGFCAPMPMDNHFLNLYYMQHLAMHVCQ